MPAEAQRRLFAPFERANRAGVEGVEGVGLGLAISRGLALLHGGGIELDSVVGEGSVFTIVLPASRVLARSRGSAGRAPSASAA